jgi:hypothetical protein
MRIAGAIACLQRVRLEGRAGGATAGVTDRHDIYLTYGFLHNIWFSHKYDTDRAAVLERMGDDAMTTSRCRSRQGRGGRTPPPATWGSWILSGERVAGVPEQLLGWLHVVGVCGQVLGRRLRG